MIQIRYCRAWNYLPRAARAAALIKEQLQLDTTVAEGNRGEFTVWVGDRLVARKDENGFPTDAAIVEAVRAATQA